MGRTSRAMAPGVSDLVSASTRASCASVVVEPPLPAVLLIGPTPPPYGGMVTYTHLLLHNLKENGVKIEFAPLPAAAGATWFARLARMRHFARAALRVIGSDADVVHCISGSHPNLLANGAVMFLVRVLGKQTVLSLVGPDVPLAARSGSLAPRVRSGVALRTASLVLACNSDIADAVVTLCYPRSRVELLTNALPEPDPGDGVALGDKDLRDFSAAHEVVIGSISGWYAHYGSDDLLTAFETLPSGPARVGLILLFKGGGDGAYARSFRSRVAASPLGAEILLLEALPDTRPFLAAIDVFVRTPLAEGDSMAVREALAVGLPVVATAAGYRPHGVIQYPPGDVDALAAALGRLVTAREPRSKESASVAEGEANLRTLLRVYRRAGAARYRRSVRGNVSAGRDA